MVHLASCGAVWQSPLCSNPCGKLLGTQQAWKPRVPICQAGKHWAAEEPGLPAPVGWSWESGRTSHRSLPGVSASLAGAGEPQMLPEPLSYFRKSTQGGSSLAYPEITILQAATAKLCLNHTSRKAVAALCKQLVHLAGLWPYAFSWGSSPGAHPCEHPAFSVVSGELLHQQHCPHLPTPSSGTDLPCHLPGSSP